MPVSSHIVINGRTINKQNGARYIASDMILPDTVQLIDSEAFLNKRKIKAVTFPDSLRQINDHAFSGCTLLKKIQLPDQLTHLGSGAFSGCTALRAAELPSELMYIYICSHPTEESSFWDPPCPPEMG